MRAPLIELNRSKLVVSYPAAVHDCRFMSPRQWGRHVFLVSSHDDRNDSETRRRICSSSFFLLLERPRPWRPTFVRINVRLATLATVPSSQLICKQQLGACCELNLKISRWFKRHHLDGFEEASGRIYDRTLVEEAHFLVVQKVDREDKETFNREGYRDFLETRSVRSFSSASAFSLILCWLWGICEYVAIFKVWWLFYIYISCVADLEIVDKLLLSFTASRYSLLLQILFFSLSVKQIHDSMDLVTPQKLTRNSVDNSLVDDQVGTCMSVCSTNDR